MASIPTEGVVIMPYLGKAPNFGSDKDTFLRNQAQGLHQSLAQMIVGNSKIF